MWFANVGSPIMQVSPKATIPFILYKTKLRMLPVLLLGGVIEKRD
jgi:hypothetical protein